MSISQSKKNQMQKFEDNKQIMVGFGLKLKNQSSDCSLPALFSEESKGNTAVRLVLLNFSAKGTRQHDYLLYQLTQSPYINIRQRWITTNEF